MDQVQETIEDGFNAITCEQIRGLVEGLYRMKEKKKLIRFIEANKMKINNNYFYEM